MRILITETAIIEGKDGREWGVLKGLLENGKNYEYFASKEEFEALAIPTDAVLSKDDIKEVFSTYKTLSVEFDQRGKLFTIS